MYKSNEQNINILCVSLINESVRNTEIQFYLNGQFLSIVFTQLKDKIIINEDIKTCSKIVKQE